MKHHHWDLLSYIIILAVATFLFVWLAGSLPGYFRRNHNLEKQLSALNEQVRQLQERNEELKKEVEVFNRPEFIEQEARERFNYHKIGEQVVVFIDRSVTGAALSETSSEKNGFFTRFKNFFRIFGR